MKKLWLLLLLFSSVNLFGIWGDGYNCFIVKIESNSESVLESFKSKSSSDAKIKADDIKNSGESYYTYVYVTATDNQDAKSVVGKYSGSAKITVIGDSLESAC